MWIRLVSLQRETNFNLSQIFFVHLKIFQKLPINQMVIHRNDHDVVNGVNADSKLLVTDTGHGTASVAAAATAAAAANFALVFLPINESIVKRVDLCSFIALIIFEQFVVAVVVPVILLPDTDAATAVAAAAADLFAEIDCCCCCCAFNRLKPNDRRANSAGGSRGMAGGRGAMYG